MDSTFLSPQINNECFIVKHTTDTDKYVLELPPPKKKIKNLLLGVFITLWSTNHLLCYPSIVQNLKCWSRKPQQNLRNFTKIANFAKIIKFVNNVKSSERGGQESPNKICELCEILWKLRKIIKFANNVKSS